jgi:PAS domain S-box-containing protein
MDASQGNTLPSMADVAALVDTSPCGISVCQDERIVYANTACVRMFGAGSSAEMVGRLMADVHPPEALVAIQERCARLPVNGYTQPAVYELRRPDGSSLRVEAVSARARWAGRPAMRTILREVAGQGGVPAAVHYRAALVQHVSDAIIGTTRDGVVTEWNSAAERIYGRSQHEALGQRVADVVGADLNPATLIFAGGITDAVHRRADGTTLAVRVSVAEMASGCVLICADETARRRAEDNHATVLDALSEGVIVVSPS